MVVDLSETKRIKQQKIMSTYESFILDGILETLF